MASCVPMEESAESLESSRTPAGLRVRFPDTVRPIFGHVEAVALHLRVEKLAMDAEHACGFGPIAGGPRQGSTDQHLLETGGGGRKVFVRPVTDFPRDRSRFVNEADIARVEDVAAHQ